ncbi:MAG TPA: hypothetical protein VGF67_05360 [Ktedonobacteraceae bacterium]
METLLHLLPLQEDKTAMNSHMVKSQITRSVLPCFLRKGKSAMNRKKILLRLLRKGKRVIRRKKILLLLSYEQQDQVAEVFEEEYPGWQWLIRTMIWPPVALGVAEIPLRESEREVAEILAELERACLINFSACAPSAASGSSEAELSGAIWQEEATELYHILFAMDPFNRFVLVFPLGRTDVAERIQSFPYWRDGWRDPDDRLRYRFVMRAETHTAPWLMKFQEAYPEFVVSPSAEAIMNDLLNLPRLDGF